MAVRKNFNFRTIEPLTIELAGVLEKSENKR